MPGGNPTLSSAGRRGLFALSVAATLLASVILLSHQFDSPDSQNRPSAWTFTGVEEATRRGRSILLQTSLDGAAACNCGEAKPCVNPVTTATGKVFPGGGVTASSGSAAFGSWDPITGVPRISCQDTVSGNGHDTRFKDNANVYGCPSRECIAPTNRFYGSTGRYKPRGTAMSVKGYTPDEEVSLPASAHCAVLALRVGIPSHLCLSRRRGTLSAA